MCHSRVIAVLTAAVLVLSLGVAARAVTLPTNNLLLRYETAGATPYDLTDGRVVSWNDQAGDATDADEYDGRGPTLVGNATPAGMPALDFDAPDRYDGDALDINNVPELDTQTLSWFLLFKAGRTDTGVLARSNYASGAGSNGDVAWGTYVETNWGLISQTRAASGSGGGALENPFTDTNDWHILSTVWNGSDAEVNANAATTISGWLDGADMTREWAWDSVNANPSGHVRTRIGDICTDRFGRYYYDGQLAAFLVYDTALSAADRASVESYLTETYVVPEPSTFVLAALGLLGLGLFGGRRQWSR